MKPSEPPDTPLPEKRSRIAARCFGGLVLLAACAFVVLHYVDSLWAPSIDIALHHALVTRLSEHWSLPTNDDPSLEEMNVMPRYSHRLAALAGKLAGSPMAGLHLVALLSLAAVWSGFGFLFYSLPRRALWTLFGLLAAALLVNRFWLHFELFGDELVGNYFYPQLVAQAGAVLLIALALWLERAKVSPVLGYGILGLAVPFLQQFHLLPALEVLAVLALLVTIDALSSEARQRRKNLGIGLAILAASLLLTVLDSAFATVVRISETHGLLNLRYTPTMPALAIESLGVAFISAIVLWQWLRLESIETRTNLLALKYAGLFGAAVAGLCLLQIALLKLGYGSEYACKKYAFGLNTALLVNMCLAALGLVRRWTHFLSEGERPFSIRNVELLAHALPGLLVALACFTVLPPLSARAITLHEVVSAEQYITAYEAANPRTNPAKYDYAIGLFPNLRIFDYLISIGTLNAPRVDNADDMLNGHAPSKPRKINRIFTREDSMPWDIPECRQATPQGGIAILDGACVLDKLQASGEQPIP